MRQGLVLACLLGAACSDTPPTDCGTQILVEGACRPRCQATTDCLPSEHCDPVTSACLAGTLPLPPSLEFSAFEVDFGNVAPGESKSLEVVLENKGGMATIVRAQRAEPPFSITDSDRDIELAPLARATFTVTFAPQSPSRRLTTVVFAIGCDGSCSTNLTLVGESTREGDGVHCGPNPYSLGTFEGATSAELLCENFGTDARSVRFSNPSAGVELVGPSEQMIPSGDAILMLSLIHI